MDQKFAIQTIFIHGECIKILTNFYSRKMYKSVIHFWSKGNGKIIKTNLFL